MDRFAPVLDVFCPMHLWLDAEGRVTHAGPTLQKLRPGSPMTDCGFFDLFEVHRPHDTSRPSELFRAAGTKLHLSLRDEPRTALKGVLVEFEGAALVNLSFGISVPDGVRDYALTGADFAPTDLTIEMLYLIEAKSAAMESSRQLNLRLQGAKIAAEEQAFTDTLTGLKNRRAADHILNRLHQSGEAYSLMHLDLDYFKSVNDTMGHAAGDHVLQQVAQVMVAETRTEDVVARVGGDEFVLIFREMIDKEKLNRIADRLIRRIEVPVTFQGKKARISASVGTVIIKDGSSLPPQDVANRADLALYVSKGSGRAMHTMYHDKLKAHALPPPSSRNGAMGSLPN